MSGVYAYCIVSAGEPARLSGLGGAPVRAVGLAGLTVWVSDAEAAPTLDLAAVRAHHLVVSSASADAVVPFRFGAWVESIEVLDARIRRSLDSLEAALRRVDGHVELGVRIVASHGVAADADAAPATSGREYLQALSRRQRERAERRRCQDDLARAASGHLGETGYDTRLTYLPSPDLVSLAHLVPRRDETYYRSCMRSFADEVAPNLAVHVTGPWPPYSFVEA